jgi:aryl-alcohol dehydrogenase-like predicted oxidoreductase
LENSKLALGTVQFGLDYGISNSRGKVDEQTVKTILDEAYSHGIRMLDTARAYGNSEEVIGNYLMAGQPYQIISKIRGGVTNPQEVLEEFEISSIALQRSSLYAYMFHQFDDLYQNPELWVAMEALKEKGKIEKAGVSLYFPWQLEWLLEQKVSLDLVQLPYSILDRRFEPYFNRLKEHQVEIHVRSVFLQGLYFMSANQLSAFFAPVKPFLNALQKNINSDVLPDLLLQFVLLNKHIDRVVIGVTSIEELKANVSATENNDLVMLNQLEIPQLNEQILIPSNWPK